MAIGQGRGGAGVFGQLRSLSASLGYFRQRFGHFRSLSASVGCFRGGFGRFRRSSGLSKAAPGRRQQRAGGERRRMGPAERCGGAGSGGIGIGGIRVGESEPGSEPGPGWASGPPQLETPRGFAGSTGVGPGPMALFLIAQPRGCLQTLRELPEHGVPLPRQCHCCVISP